MTDYQPPWRMGKTGWRWTCAAGAPEIARQQAEARAIKSAEEWAAEITDGLDDGLPDKWPVASDFIRAIQADALRAAAGVARFCDDDNDLLLHDADSAALASAVALLAESRIRALIPQEMQEDG